MDVSTGTKDQTCCRILYRLESVEQLTRHTGKYRTSVVEPRQDKRHTASDSSTGRVTDRRLPVSYTHLTLPTKRIV